ncbi:MAG TPA: hypothetical protein ENN46_01175 [Candidatus Woesearchaeota archaeon]|nr:hypothetical protein [Candidatus Woesearchaeota archaeon]
MFNIDEPGFVSIQGDKFQHCALKNLKEFAFQHRWSDDKTIFVLRFRDRYNQNHQELAFDFPSYDAADLFHYELWKLLRKHISSNINLDALASKCRKKSAEYLSEKQGVTT